LAAQRVTFARPRPAHPLTRPARPCLAVIDSLHDRSCSPFNMLKRQPNTGKKLLEHGLTLISQEGLAGVTLGRLALQVGMSKSGVFAHFSSKTDVQIALLEHTAQFVALRVIEPALQQPAGLPTLRALVQNWFGWSGRAGLAGGCPIAAAMFELDDVESPVRDKVQQMEAAWRSMLGQLVADAIAARHLRADLDVEQFVWELCGIYLSHHVSTRFVRDAQADVRGQTAWQALLDRAQPTAAGVEP
jgi:AcrR family transcriptional regulator